MTTVFAHLVSETDVHHCSKSPIYNRNEMVHDSNQIENAPCILSAWYDCLSLSKKVAYISLDASLALNKYRFVIFKQEERC